MNPDVFIIDTWDAFDELCVLVEHSDYKFLSLDVETDSPIEKTAKLFGIGLCFEDNVAYYIPIRKNTEEIFWSEESLKEIYWNIYVWCQTHKLIGHNLIFDVLVFENNTGYNISDCIYSDSILQKHLLDEERPFGLKEVAVKYLGPGADKAQQKMIESVKANGGTVTKDQFEMWKADTDILGEYCAWDTILSFKLFNLFEARIIEEGLYDLFYKDEIIPLYKTVTIPMKRQGFHVDVEHFKNLKKSIYEEISRLEWRVLNSVAKDIEEFEQKLLDKDYPYSRKGTFPKICAAYFHTELPHNKEGKVTLSAKEVLKASQEHPCRYYDWLLGRLELEPFEIRDIQMTWFRADAERKYVFNLKSNDHLGWLLFTKLGETPASKTETGKPQCDEEYLETLVEKYPWVQELVDYKKLNKLAATYIDGILERQIDGVIYTSYLMFGTTSGRFSSKNPNLQNLPRVKEDDAGLSELVLKYTNAIKAGFVAPKGYKLVNADYSALEPRCFAHVSGDNTLRNVFKEDLDLYSQVAIDVFGLTDCSADPKAPNYLKKKYPEKRQLAKIFVLAVVYGAEANRISQAMGIDYKEAEHIIESYLEAYPELSKYMSRCDILATTKGIARTDFGRVRHLPVAKEIYSRYGHRILNRKWAKANGLSDTRYRLKNALNNSKNFPIQGLAAHIVNRAAIRANQLFKEHNLDAVIIANVHDELCCVSREEHATLVKDLLKDAMENTVKISVPMIAEPIIANNWKEAK